MNQIATIIHHHQDEICFLEQLHQLNSPVDWLLEENPFIELPAELIQVLDKFDGGTLFADTENPWYIKPLKDYSDCEIVEYNQYFTNFITLKDNRCIAFASVERKNGHWTDEN